MSFIKKHKRQREMGFTLAEIMTTMVMMVVLATIVFVNYKSSQKQLALQRATNRLAQDIRRAENMAGTEWGNCNKNGGYHHDYKYGYGLFFPNQSGGNSYNIFADCDGNNHYNSGNDEIVEQINIESGIICRTQPAGGNDVVFILPDPIVSNPIEVSLEIENSNPLQSKTVTINSIGAVDFK
jgi:type II secretory pathway pseudopilin PulG